MTDIIWDSNVFHINDSEPKHHLSIISKQRANKFPVKFRCNKYMLHSTEEPFTYERRAKCISLTIAQAALKGILTCKPST
jgi:hypothetical protein